MLKICWQTWERNEREHTKKNSQSPKILTTRLEEVEKETFMRISPYFNHNKNCSHLTHFKFRLPVKRDSFHIQM